MGILVCDDCGVSDIPCACVGVAEVRERDVYVLLGREIVRAPTGGWFSTNLNGVQYQLSDHGDRWTLFVYHNAGVTVRSDPSSGPEEAARSLLLKLRAFGLADRFVPTSYVEVAA